MPQSIAKRRVGRAVGVAIAVVAAVTTPVAAAHAAPAAPSVAQKLQDDFNGDGYQDLAVAASRGKVDGQAQAGYVAVVYGSAKGLDLTHKQVISQNTPGIPGAAETNDDYGDGLAAGDLDGDSYADLVVGAPGETVGEVAYAGTLAVLWGGKQGLSGGTAVATGTEEDRVDPETPALGDFNGDGQLDLATGNRLLYGPFDRTKGAAKSQTLALESEYFTDDVAAGDVDHDGITDLVALIHDRSDDDMHDPDYKHRRAVFLRGTRDGLSAPAPVNNPDGTRMRGGESLGVGDVDKDGYADLVIGRPNDGYGEVDLDDPLLKGGQIGVVHGSAQGPDTSRTTIITQDTPGVPGSPEWSDGFGGSISVGDVNADGYADVSTGSASEDLGEVYAAGQVTLLRGGKKGLTGDGAYSISQNTENVPGTAEQNDFFGADTNLLDVNDDGRAELFAGATGENRDGGVWAFPNPVSTPTATGSVSFGAGTLGTVRSGSSLGRGFAH
ncbi:FG-GAP-like repeat-containing protein [Streptomyces sp. NRRL B-1140]|uniref:FG-GAP-like repeat-containing protein n=1 Tax=Streptomyces sp. NRRL B-1140 TaxID=1415549 RepID=UPI00099C6355|nr:FG-GAP-like repeat-containing protein [Streptomyces sp. NRRL B-1140]